MMGRRLIPTVALAERRLRIDWRERGGPPVAPAARRGFGTRMLEKLLDPESGDSVIIRFEPAGVVCVFELELGAPGEMLNVS